MPVPRVQDTLRSVAMGRSRFLYGLDRVPDDRLNWSPGGDAPTPLKLAGKTARVLRSMAHIIQHRTWPERGVGASDDPADREAAKAVLEEAFAGLRQVIVNLSEADLAAKIPAPWGEAPLQELVGATPSVIGYHQGQLNLLQLIWGDTDANIPPNWGKEES